jgi:hypothetical protein
VKDFLLPQVRARFSAGWLLISCDYPKSHRISKHFLSGLLITKYFSGHFRATHPRSWILWIEKYLVLSRLENTPDASGLYCFSVFLNPQRSFGSEHNFFTQLLVAYTTTAASLWF